MTITDDGQPPRIRPNALVIGAQKAATTAIIKNLRTLDNVWAPSKELHFFSVHWERGTDWYEKAFSKLVREVKPERYNARLLLEKSPSYMADPKSAERIRDFDPSMKIIACLRNPIDRAFSRYNDIRIDEPERINLSFEEVIARGIANPDHFLKNGLYAMQLRPFFEHFPREQICLVVQERLESRGPLEMDILLSFLGLTPGSIELQRFNANAYELRISTETRNRLRDFYQKPNEELFQLIGFSIPEWVEEPHAS
ncbi:MAG: sulfotransferase domain-containing protein [Cyanobacteria bacterium J06638_22]